MPAESYIVPLQEAYLKPRTKRANYAIRALYKFISKHTRKTGKDVIISNELNNFIWKDSIKKPARKVAVSLKIDNGKVYVFLKDSKELNEFLKKSSEVKEEKKKKVSEKKDENTEKKAEPSEKPKVAEAKPAKEEKTNKVKKE